MIDHRVDILVETIPPDVLSATATATGLSEAAILAIAAIEGGSASKSAVRFECHLFNRRSSSGPVPCTVGSIGYSRVRSETDWDAFVRAYSIDQAVAVAVTSWGAFQVLDPIKLGVASSTAHWLDRWYHEDRWGLSFELLTAWLQRHGRALQAAKDAEASGGMADHWAEFARRYNGSGYAKHNYHGKLAEAYQYARSRGGA